MFMKAVFVAGMLMLISLQAGFAAEGAGGLFVDSNDSLRTILERQVGQTVEVRLKSGDKLSGKVANVGDKLLHLSQLVGQEFYDAAIDVKDVTAVIVRVRQK